MGQAGIADDQRALGVEQLDVFATGEARHPHGPGAGRVNHLFGDDADRFLASIIAADRGSDDAVLDVEADGLRMGQVGTAVERLRVVDVAERDVEGVNGGVGHRIGGEDTIAERRFAFAGLGRGQGLAVDAGFGAMVREALGVVRIVTGDGDEQAAAGIDAVGGDAFEDFGLFSTLGGRLRVIGDVAPTAMQKPVVAARRPGIEVLAVDQQAVDAAQRQVAHDAGAGDAAADNQDVRLVGLGFAHGRVLQADTQRPIWASSGPRYLRSLGPKMPSDRQIRVQKWVTR